MNAPLRLLRAASWAFEPVVAAVFLLLWIVAEIGRGVPGIGFITGIAIALALARVVPIVTIVLLPAVVLAEALGVLGLPGSTDWPAYLGIAIATCLLTVHAGWKLSFWVLGSGGAAAVGAAALLAFQSDDWTSWTSMFRVAGATGLEGQLTPFLIVAVGGLLIVGLFWAAGIAVRVSGLLAITTRETRGMADRLAKSEIELAVVQERNRIAQEMHDVLAHSLAVIVAQADGARYVRPTRPDAVDQSLTRIANTARGALVDVRGVIDDLLDGVTPPQPGIEDLPDLVESVRSAGVEVAVTEAGERGELAPGQQLAVYRIVQEGLTNALRHRGPGSAVALVFDWRGPGLALQLVSSVVPADGETPAAAPARADAAVSTDAPARTDAAGEAITRTGLGIAGMRERARLAGGWLAAGSDESGDHRITAFVPYRLPAEVGAAGLTGVAA